MNHLLSVIVFYGVQYQHVLNIIGDYFIATCYWLIEKVVMFDFFSNEYYTGLWYDYLLF